MKINKRFSVNAFIAVLLAFSLSAYRLLRWTLGRFGDLTSDQIVFHVFHTLAGTPVDITNRLSREVMFKPFIAVVIFIGLLWLFKRFRLLSNTVQFIAVTISITLLISTSLKTYSMLKLPPATDSFIIEYKNIDWFDKFYVNPVIITPPQTNLVWIYFESLEIKHVTPTNFPQLNGPTIYGGFTGLMGSNWTYAGMVSSQCGVPLLLNPTKTQNTSFPHTRCLSDILNEQGYDSYYVGGDPIYFSGKDRFMKAHHFVQVLGKSELEKHLGYPPPDSASAWGYNDEQVLSFLEAEIERLHSSGKKFYYLANTLDTHGPYIYTKKCQYQGFANTKQDIYSCGLRRVSDMIDRLESKGILANTTIIITGDHPAKEALLWDWKNTYKKQIPYGEVFFFARPADELHLTDSNLKHTGANHFDMMPLALSQIGGKLAHNAAGLGRDITATDSLMHRLNKDSLNYLFRHPTTTYSLLLD